MVLVEGFDRTDNCPYLCDMSDELWRQHTQEVMIEFEKAKQTDDTIQFAVFCQDYFCGRKFTAAMEEHAKTKQ